MFWMRPACPIVIPSELHDKLARTSQRIEEIDSAVICVRTVPPDAKHDLEQATASTGMTVKQKVCKDEDLSDAIGYEAHWQWYR